VNQDNRLVHEIEHGKFLISRGAGEVWNWESPAGKVRWKRRVEMLSNALRPGSQVLELGCGTGYFTAELIRMDVHITAIDISPELIEEANLKINAKNVQFLVENAYQTSFNNEQFDAIIGSSILHHLEIRKAVSEIFRLLKPGGVIAFTEPNMLNPQIALQKNIPWLKRKLGDSPDETAFFRWRLKKIFSKAGFSEIHIIPFDFLHPAIPAKLISSFSAIGLRAEKIPLIKEIAGSLFIKAFK